MNNEAFDVIVLGGGPAGLTAAIYSSRAFLKTLVIAGTTPGGQLMLTTEVENFPGFPNGIYGPELVIEMRKQAEKFNSTFVNKDAAKVSGNYQEGFLVETSDGFKYMGKTLIVATGASARWLGLESEFRLRGKGVSACATCDGFFFQNKTVAVVGGGDSAMEESIFLTKFANKVYVLVRKSKESLKASKIMQDRAMKNPKIEFLYNTEVVEVLGGEKVSGINIKNNQTGEQKVLGDVEGLFVAIGYTPNTGFLTGLVDLDEQGYIKVTSGTRTNADGIFVGGDVSDYRYRQAVTAAGIGCMAALDAEKFIAEHHLKV